MDSHPGRLTASALAVDHRLVQYARVARDLPSGTVSFLFTDVEGSTRLLHALGAEEYAGALAEHRRILRNAFTAHGGVEVDTQGDAFFVAFPTAPGALAAAADARELLATGSIRVRMGLHTGTPHLTDEGYVGADVHRAARIAAAGHGGQILVSSATAALLDDTSLRDLGAHRLKDLSAPERIYQLGEDEHPPLKSLHQTNLPLPVDSFVGRDAELAEIEQLLGEGGVRMLTLAGPGGTGKTRLAVQAAANLAPNFPGGVFWVGLAPLRDATLVLDAIGASLGAQGDVADDIGDRHVLLVLDNLEQVVDAAPQLVALVEACPNLRLIVTSRELLRVRGERAYAVNPLVERDAVELFCERASVVRDATIEELCAGLDNLPLAIELAAARTSVLSPRQIIDRLAKRLDLLRGGRDVEPRQQTLRMTIEWSYDLLTPEEKRLFARLGIFHGGWTLEAAEQVVDAEIELLQSLIDKSLVQRRDDRFSMLETIRQYAEELLRLDIDEHAVRERHLTYLTDLAERAYAERVVANSRWLPILNAEHDNIRAALDWAAGDPGIQLRLAGAIAPYWTWAGHVREARERLLRVIARHDARDHASARGLISLGSLTDDRADAHRILNDALSLSRDLKDASSEAAALEAIGLTHLSFGEYEAARSALEQSLTLRNESGAAEAEGLRAVAQLCHVLVATGEIERAEPMARELCELGATYGAAATEELGLHFRADCALISGDYAEAEDRYREALLFARRSGLVYRETDELLGVAMALAGAGDHDRAVRLAAAARMQDEALGFAPGDNWWDRIQEKHIGRARSELGPDRTAAAERAGTAVPFEMVLDEILGVPA